MKYIVVVPDGAADYPLEALNGKTPLEVADTPFMDKLASQGILGRVRTVPLGFSPSSDVANLSLLGYDPEKYYTGRGPLEAANLGVDLGEKDLAFRCNLITENNNILLDYSAGHITDKEASLLIDALNESLGSEQIRFYLGKSYRNLMVYREGLPLGLDKLKYWPPHDIIGKSIIPHLPKGDNANIIIELMNKSKEVLRAHEINKVRIDLGESPANMIWLWGCGPRPSMESFQEKFGLKGAVISAVDLIKGIGKLANLKVIEVEGATGYYDTNYQGKAEGALRALEEVDFVFVHIEATDEASHNQDLRMKIICLERIDKFVLGTIIEKLNSKKEKFRILVVPDHPTPIARRTHTNEPVPFLIAGEEIEKGGFNCFSELEAQNSNLYFDKGVQLLQYFLKR